VVVTAAGHHFWHGDNSGFVFDCAPFFPARRGCSGLLMSYDHVFYSQDARGYTAMLFGGLLATLALIEALEHRSPWAWVIYCGGMLICVGSVAIGSVVLAGHLLAVTLLRPNLIFYVVFAITEWLLLHLYFFIIPDVLGFIFGDYTRPEGGGLHFSSAFGRGQTFASAEQFGISRLRYYW
jgi:hypothetical protein